MTVTLSRLDKEKLAFVNQDKWPGKGKGMVGLELEGPSDHCQKVIKTAQLFAPEATYYDLGDVAVSDMDGIINLIKKVKPHVVSVSCKWNIDNYGKVADYLHSVGIPFFVCAGNDGDEMDARRLAQHPYTICIGIAEWLRNGQLDRENISQYGNNLKFMGFGYVWDGTSISTPACGLGMSLLIMERYGLMNQEQLEAFWKRNCLDMGAAGFDKYTGYGLIRLPIIRSDSVKIQMVIGSKNVQVDDKVVALDVAPVKINGVTMVPLRFVSEQLGKSVEYVKEPTKVERITIEDRVTVK